MRNLAICPADVYDRSGELEGIETWHTQYTTSPSILRPLLSFPTKDIPSHKVVTFTTLKSYLVPLPHFIILSSTLFLPLASAGLKWISLQSLSSHSYLYFILVFCLLVFCCFKDTHPTHPSPPPPPGGCGQWAALCALLAFTSYLWNVPLTRVLILEGTVTKISKSLTTLLCGGPKQANRHDLVCWGQARGRERKIFAA